jgi:hypothetical protein
MPNPNSCQISKDKAKEKNVSTLKTHNPSSKIYKYTPQPTKISPTQIINQINKQITLNNTNDTSSIIVYFFLYFL